MMKSTWGRSLLWVASICFGAGARTRNFLYDLRLLPSRKVRAKVVGIGNLTTGGTGKTPATVLAAMTLRRRDQHVAILSRGYGRPVKSPDVCVLHDDSVLDWRQCGDEPWMMHQLLKGQNIPILISPDRSRAALQAVTFFDSHVIILDDGFQHRRLKRDLDIVLINATNPFGGGKFLPLGNLREPLRSLKRAGMILLTHIDLVAEGALESLRQELHAVNPRAALLESVHKPDFLLEVKTERKQRLSHLEGREVAALSGLADPVQFEDCLAHVGMAVAQKWRYPDHHRFTRRELASVDHLLHGMPLVTTFKDVVRFPTGWRELLRGEVYALAIKLDIVKGKNAWTDALLGLTETPG